MKKLLLIAFIPSSVFLYSQDSIARIDSNLLKLNPFPVEIRDGYTPLPIIYPPYDIITPIWTLPTNFVWVLAESNYNRKGAKKDIKANKMKVLFPGVMIESDRELNSLKDKALQNKYQVEFYRQPIEHITHLENEKAYNQTIFASLDEKYGQDWRFEMRSDAIGFEIPDSLFRKKAEEVMTALPEINLKDHIKGLPIKKPTSLPLMIGIVVPVTLVSVVAIFFIFRRKNKSK